jgi:hypothetical protein
VYSARIFWPKLNRNYQARLALKATTRALATFAALTSSTKSATRSARRWRSGPTEVAGDALLVRGDRLVAFAARRFDQARLDPRLRRVEAHRLIDDLEWLLLRKPIEEPDEAELVGKAEPVIGRRHLPICTRSFSARVAAVRLS